LPIVRIQNLNDENAPFNYYDGEYNPVHEINDGELLFSWSGTPGTSFGAFRWFRGKGVLNQHIFRVIPKIDVDKEYLKYALNGNIQTIISKAHGGVGLQHITKKELDEVQIHIVPVEQQQEIVAILCKVEELIKNRKKELQKLDDLIKARFVEMFGGESNPFQWPIINVEEVANVSVGVVIKPAQYYTDAEHGVKAFRSLNIGPMSIKDGDWVYFSHEGNDKNAKSQLKENDLLIVRSGAPGTACVVSKQYEGCNAIDIIIARPNTERINPYYLCTYTNMPHGKRQIDEGTGGAAQQHFNVGKYNKLRLMLPPMDLQNEFAAFVAQVDKSKFVVQKALDKTQLLFDSLMQQYFG
ncbi:MAG: restriction endonuclease subunit S, partial [Parasporobacterium sp.]|nr:restriction endonuclease subunit S [Parasporobacterium sp.]